MALRREPRRERAHRGMRLVRRRLKAVAVVMDLHEFTPVGGRPAGGRDGRWFERFTEAGEDLPDRAGLGDERDQPDVAAARRALEGKLLPHPRQQLGLWRREVSCERGFS